ncbi:MAG: YceI family protein [Rhodoferax sp.]|nr:YceI family protein [Rhodoferax sp.]
MKKTIVALATASALFATMSHAQSASYALDPAHTYVIFEISHFGTSTNRGRFDKKEGTVQLDKAAKTGKVEVTIDSTSISTGSEAFNKHLRSADLFDAEKYPTIKFTGDKFTFNGDKVSQITGNLTLLGKTREVTLKATQFNCYTNPMLKRETCGGDFETTIDRTQFGMNYGLDWGFPKEVRLVIQAEAIKQ